MIFTGSSPSEHIIITLRSQNGRSSILTRALESNEVKTISGSFDCSYLTIVFFPAA